MPTTRKSILHDNVLGGVDTTLPAHLIDADKWRTQHNFRLTPAVVQVPRKYPVSWSVSTTEDVRWLGAIPSDTPAHSTPVALCQTKVFRFVDGTQMATGLVDDGVFRRWSTALYNNVLYYINELNSLRTNDGNFDAAAGGPQGRYLAFWYDHCIVARPLGFPNRLLISDLYKFGSTGWNIIKANEADYYDFVENQQTDYPYSGITGIGKLHSTLYVYTPSAIFPVRYVGLPKIFQVNDEGVITRNGNTFPWTLVCLDTVHFYFDAVEVMFWAFNGQTVESIGEPVRQFMKDNLTTDPILMQKMYGFIDVDFREIWWVFPSTASAGAFDKAVVFNYRYKHWFTASVEDVQSFYGGTRLQTKIGQLTGLIGALPGTIGSLGIGAGTVVRSFGTNTGVLMQEELSSTPNTSLIAADNPVLETADFHYGDIRTTKENDAMVLNAFWPTTSNVLLVPASHVGLIFTFSLPGSNLYYWDMQAGDVKCSFQTTTLTASGIFYFGSGHACTITSANSSVFLYQVGYVEVRAIGRDYLGSTIDWTDAATVKGSWHPFIQDSELNYPAISGRVLRYRFEFFKTRVAQLHAFSDRVYVQLAEK